MGFFSELFVSNETEKAEIAGSIDVMAAINAHVLWKIRLDKYLNGTSEEVLDSAVIGRDDQSTLGKWIHGTAREYFEGDEGFNTLRDDHAWFHVLAGKIVNKVQGNDKAGAQALMQGEYALASRKVVKDLTELGKLLTA